MRVIQANEPEMWSVTDPFLQKQAGSLLSRKRLAVVIVFDVDEVSFPLFIYLLMSLLYWNSCGMGNANPLNHVKYMVSLWKLNLIFIAEPRISGASTLQSCRKLGFECWHREEASSMSRGLWGSLE